jgi:hypothetical protein
MDQNLSVLVEAKDEYQGIMVTVMMEPMIKVFHEMFMESQRMSKGRKVLQMFQSLLKEVPSWSNTMSRTRASEIEGTYSSFSELLAAVLVSNVKILSAVRIQSGNRKLSLKLPTNDVFIQTVYNNAAKDLYDDPYVFTTSQSEYERNKQLDQRFRKIILDTIKQSIPVQEILSTYMTPQESGGNELDVEESEPVDDDDLEQSYGEEKQEGEGEVESGEDGGIPSPPPLDEYPNGAPVDAPEEIRDEEETPEVESDPSGVPFETEVGVKTIPTSDTPEEDDGDDSFFDDAPDARTKKPRYI